MLHWKTEQGFDCLVVTCFCQTQQCFGQVQGFPTMELIILKSFHGQPEQSKLIQTKINIKENKRTLTSSSIKLMYLHGYHYQNTFQATIVNV